MKTTLNKIRACQPCDDGWAKLLRGLNKTGPDDEPLLLETVLDLNGLSDAIWCLRAVDRDVDRDVDRGARLFSVWCARQVEHLLTDDRSRNAINVAERFANGLASISDLAAACDAAWDAWDACDAAWVAAAVAVESDESAAWAWDVCAAVSAAVSAAWSAPAQTEMFRAMCRGAAPWQLQEIGG